MEACIRNCLEIGIFFLSHAASPSCTHSGISLKDACDSRRAFNLAISALHSFLLTNNIRPHTNNLRSHLPAGADIICSRERRRFRKQSCNLIAETFYGATGGIHEIRGRTDKFTFRSLPFTTEGFLPSRSRTGNTRPIRVCASRDYERNLVHLSRTCKYLRSLKKS